MDLNTIWIALIEGFAPLGNSEMENAANESGVGDGWITWLWAGWLFDSEPFSTGTFMRIRPYGSVQVNEERFALAVKLGFLSILSSNEHKYTKKGKQVVEQIVRSTDEAIAHLQPVPPAELQKKYWIMQGGLWRQPSICLNRPPNLPWHAIIKTCARITICHCSD